jgi:hypothetical protein
MYCPFALATFHKKRAFLKVEIFIVGTVKVAVQEPAPVKRNCIDLLPCILSTVSKLCVQTTQALVPSVSKSNNILSASFAQNLYTIRPSISRKYISS